MKTNMALQAKEKFDAAVRVIHGLPKNGGLPHESKYVIVGDRMPGYQQDRS